MHRAIVFAAFALIVFGVTVAAVMFLAEGTWLTQMKDRGDSVAVVLAVVALMLGALSMLTVFVSESSDYRALQALKADLAKLLVALNTILINEAMRRGQGAAAHPFSAEKTAVHEFLNSTSALGMYALIADRSRTAGDAPSKWRVLPMHLWEVVIRDDRHGVAMHAAQAQAVLKTLRPADLHFMMRHLSDLVRGISEFKVAQSRDPLVSAMLDTLTPREASRDVVESKMRALQATGVADPDVDLFVAVFDRDEAGLSAALAAGADQTQTDAAVLARHGARLTALGF